MSKYLSRGLALVLFTGGLTLLGAGIANAADTTGDDGLLSGTQIVAPVTAPIDVAGNAISVLGDALSGGAAAPAAAPVAAPAAAAPSTSGSDSVLGGTQAVVDATAPVTVQGNAISVVGDSVAVPVAAAPAAPVTAPVAPAAPADAPTTSGSDSIGGGTQVAPDVALPISIGGNAISILGDAASTGSSASTEQEGTSDDATTTGNDGAVSGTQIVPVIALPITVGGNAISVLGDAEVAPTGGTTGSTSGGGEIPIDPTAPVLPTSPTEGVGDTGGTIVTIAAGETTGMRLASGGGVTTTAALSAQSLASTGFEIMPFVGVIALLLIAGIALLMVGRRRAV